MPTESLLLWAVAGAFILLGIGWVWSAGTGRLHPAGVLAVLMPVAAIGWWHIAAWSSPHAEKVTRAATVANVVLILWLLAPWIIATATRARAKRGVL